MALQRRAPSVRCLPGPVRRRRRSCPDSQCLRRGSRTLSGCRHEQPCRRNQSEPATLFSALRRWLPARHIRRAPLAGWTGGRCRRARPRLARALATLRRRRYRRGTAPGARTRAGGCTPAAHVRGRTRRRCRRLRRYLARAEQARATTALYLGRRGCWACWTSSGWPPKLEMLANEDGGSHETMLAELDAAMQAQAAGLSQSMIRAPEHLPGEGARAAPAL